MDAVEGVSSVWLTRDGGFYLAKLLMTHVDFALLNVPILTLLGNYLGLFDSARCTFF
jgi:hypothetical protein